MTYIETMRLRLLVADLAVAVAECSMPHGQPSGRSEVAYDDALSMLAEVVGGECAREGPSRGSESFQSLAGVREGRDRLRRLCERSEASENARCYPEGKAVETLRECVQRLEDPLEPARKAAAALGVYFWDV